MKIEQAKKAFQPITLTIESMEELVILAAGVGNSSADGIKSTARNTFKTEIKVDYESVNTIFKTLHEKIKEYQ